MRAGQARLAAAGVTTREAEILAAIGRRLSNREIADRMFISVRTVESHVSALLRKLGVSGRPALIDLGQQLAGRAVLPVPVTSFVGRDKELAEVSDMLAVSPLVCLVGPAGCGKTRLALEVARRWGGEVRLAELSSATAGNIGGLIAAALGIGYEASDLVAAARVTLAGTEILLVADNCEHIAEAAGSVLGTLARNIPGLHVLATSRSPLGDSAERVLVVRPLPVPSGTMAEDVSSCAASQLFIDRAVAASAQFRLDEASAPHVAAICRRLDGLPLAIELAAAQAGNLGVMELAEGLQRRPEVLGRPGRAGRHNSLSSAIAWSWQLLDSAERSLLCRLAALPGEFTLALAETIGPGPGVAELGPILMRLAEQSLISVRLPEGEPARYCLLTVIRAFALERASAADTEPVLRAHALFFHDVAVDAVRARYQTKPAPRARTDFDQPNLLAALAWSAAHDPDLADRLLILVSQLVETEPSRQALELIRDIATQRSSGWSSEALAWAGVVVQYLSLEDAELLARNSHRAAANTRDTAFASWISGWIHSTRNEESLAVRCLDVAIGYARRAPEPLLEALALQARGVARADSQQSFADWEQAVVRFVTVGDLWHANNVRFMLADGAVDTDTRLDDVPVWLDECETYAASHGFTHELAHTWLARARYQQTRNDPRTARQLLDAALPVFQQAGDFRCTARTLFELAQPSITSEPATAADLLLQCLCATAISKGPAMRAQVLARLIIAGAAAGDMVLAARCLGALTGLSTPAERPVASPAPPPLTDPALKRTLQGPAYATFVSEGHAGGIDLITTLYPR